MFKQYRRIAIAELREYVPGEPVTYTVNPVDVEAGSPKEGDMVARDPRDHNAQWLIPKAYFDANFEAMPESKPEEAVEE